MSYLPFLVPRLPTDRLSDFGNGELFNNALLKVSVGNLKANGCLMKRHERKTTQAKLEQPEVEHEIKDLAEKWEELFAYLKRKDGGYVELGDEQSVACWPVRLLCACLRIEPRDAAGSANQPTSP